MGFPGKFEVNVALLYLTIISHGKSFFNSGAAHILRLDESLIDVRACFRSEKPEH